ncbi:MAG TPA: anthranilate synthase component I [Pseudomonadales bacterium]
MKTSNTHAYRTRGGIDIYRASVGIDYVDAAAELIAALDSRPGVLLSSSYEYPGRYARWDIGFTNPPLRIVARGRRVELDAMNARGEVLIDYLRTLFADDADLIHVTEDARHLVFDVKPAVPVLVEEERTRQRSVFTFLRRFIAAFTSLDDDFLGLYGAFGYELAFQFEPVVPRLQRTGMQRDMVLYLPDTLLAVDHKREVAQLHYYDFAFTAQDCLRSTRGLARDVARTPFVPAPDAGMRSDHAPGEYEQTVRRALDYFARGDLFEAVPGQCFEQACRDSPSAIFRRLQQQNPAPYGALINLGDSEYLVAASPEMFVRVEGRRVETCPISGTIARGRDAMEDAAQIRTLLNSAKDEAELSMCTDVDRNDKARVCEPGSVRVIGRRQLELYSRLIHTVDHVEGTLREDFDALDAFLSHAWAVTVTGAPKHGAMQFIEDHELTPRAWYGGALGCLNFNGNANTGLTIRTMQIRHGVATVRAGATLLFDSDPAAEEAETRLKASALLRALDPVSAPGIVAVRSVTPLRNRVKVLMVDHEDSFVHTLASYLREAGAELVTVRQRSVSSTLERMQPQLVVLSPGPGRPDDFAMRATLEQCLARGIPVFGVCLGLQGIVEYFGGSLRRLEYPMHGRQSELVKASGFLFEGLERPLHVGRYHSLVADKVPGCLAVSARTADGNVMAVQHRRLPVAAVQFHPESILMLAGDTGRRMIGNVLEHLVAAAPMVQAGSG